MSTDKDKNQYDKSSPFSYVVTISESNDEDDVFTDSMSSHTTVSDFSELMKPNAVQGSAQDTSILQSSIESVTGIQFSSSMPYIDGSHQTDIYKDNVLKR